MLKPLAFLAVLALCAGVAHAARAAPPEPADAGAGAATDVTVDVVSLQPPSGSTLKVNQPVIVKLRYRYAQPTDDVMIWAKLLEPGLHTTYQAAPKDTPPGTGVIERFVTLDDPGAASRITIVVKNAKLQEIFSKDVPVNYKWVPNPRVEAGRDDGVGSRVLDVRFTPGSPAVLKAGTKVDVQLDVDIRDARSLQPWVEPITACRMTYDGTDAVPAGRSTVHKGFTVGEACQVTKLKVAMKNVANVEVFSEIVDVDFRFID